VVLSHHVLKVTAARSRVKSLISSASYGSRAELYVTQRQGRIDHGLVESPVEAITLA
jgi:hypothetical protein